MSIYKLLIIVGMTGSGKSTVTEYLSKKEFRVVRFGAITIQEVERRNLDICEKNERIVREELRLKYGPEAYAKLSVEQICKSLKEYHTVIDGLYSWSELTFLKSVLSAPFSIISVFTSKDIRYARLSQRTIRPLSRNEAESRDIAEIENIEKGGPIAFSDFVILNNTDLTSMQKQLDTLLGNLGIL